MPLLTVRNNTRRYDKNWGSRASGFQPWRAGIADMWGNQMMFLASEGCPGHRP